MSTQLEQLLARNARTRIVRNLEWVHPGMVVFTEPFMIQHPDRETREKEIAACAKLKAEFKQAGVAVQVVLTSVGAYVLRAKAGLRTCASEQLKRCTGKHGYAGRKKGGQFA